MRIQPGSEVEMIGKVVGSYKIVEKIGEGGMGAVYRAVDVMLEREAAIKAIRPDLAREPQIVERFRAEARTLARLHHPAIAMIYSFFHEGGDLYLAMEFVQGRPLSEVLQEEGRLPWERAVPLFASALDGIEQAHRIGVIHRDLKPDNLMLTPARTLKVMDFGIARVVGSSHLTRTGLLVGTLRYMAPEQIRGEEVGRSTDIYSLGIVLYEMVTGRPPFQGASDYAILRAQIEDPPAPPSRVVPELPGWIDEVILKALAKEPAERFQSVAELHAALARHVALSSMPLSAGSLDAVSIPPTPPVSQAVSEPTRPDRRVGGADQQPTIATAPKSLPTASAAIPVSPQPTGAGSYRPIGPGKGKHLWATAVVVLLIAMAGAGTVAWVQGRHSAEPATVTLPESAPPTLATEPTLFPSPSPTPVSAPRAGESGESRPTSVPPPAQTRPSPRPQLPVSVETRPSPSPVPAPETRNPEQAPAEPAEPETPAGTGQEMLPLEEMQQLAGELKTESAQLYALYEAFLEGKEDSGAELTPEDEQLLEELEHFEDAAAGFNGQLKGGFLGRVRGRRPGDRSDRPELRSRLRTLVERGQRVDALMAQVQPGPEVRESWQGVRRRWKRVGALVGGAGGGG